MALKVAIVRVHDQGELEPEILMDESLMSLLEAHFGFRAKSRARKLSLALEEQVKLKTVQLP